MRYEEDKVLKDGAGAPSIYFSDSSQKEKATELQEVYSTGKSEEERNKFDQFKL